MHTIKDAKIALLEARMSSEMANLTERYGARPYCVPAVREARIENSEQVSTFIDHLVHADIDSIIFLTGVGVNALFEEAKRLERLPELLDRLRAMTVVCRGPKPSAVLKRNDVHITISAREPHTTHELLEALSTLDVQGQGVGILHYGERNAALVEALQQRGARVEELCLYEWRLPEDIEPLQALVHSIIAGQVDAVVFTSQVQVRHLFQIAANLKLTQELTHALNTRTTVASIGPTCTGVLQSYGITPHVIPEHPKMGHLIKALATYMS